LERRREPVGVPRGDVPVTSASLGAGNGLLAYTAAPYPVTATSDFKQFSTIYRYDGTGTPANPPKLSVAGGVVPTAITLATVLVSLLSAKIAADGS